MKIVVKPKPITRIGIDLEALPMVSWNSVPTHRLAISVAWGTADNIHYIQAADRRPGRFALEDLEQVRKDLVQDDAVIVGHNVLRYDLPLLSGLFVAHDLEPLPDLRAQDTMGNLKSGTAYRNTLKAQCFKYGINLKTGSPDWDRVLQGYEDEWRIMEAYNKNDVTSTLQLERALAEHGIAVPLRKWKSRKAAA